MTQRGGMGCVESGTTVRMPHVGAPCGFRIDQPASRW